MAEQKIPIFSRVRCRAYLKSVKDGVHMIAYDADGAFCWETNKPMASVIAYSRKPDEVEEKEIKDLSAFEGDGVVKTYRERTEADFTGVVVGYKRVAVKGIIGTDYFDNGFSKHAYCFKHITESPLAAVVYFKNNCKRYVLPVDMEAGRMAELKPCPCDTCVFFPPSSGDGKPCCVCDTEDPLLNCYIRRADNGK